MSIRESSMTPVYAVRRVARGNTGGTSKVRALQGAESQVTKFGLWSNADRFTFSEKQSPDHW